MTLNTLPARIDPRPLLGAAPIVAVLRARHAREYAPVIDALVAGGVRAIELTLSTDGVFDELPDLIQRFGTDATIGVGTITTAADAGRCLALGAAFLVTPTTELDVVELAVRAGIPCFPGGLTPTELHRGWAAGASAVKVFPASTVGPDYLNQLRGPFPQLLAMPSGGVGAEEAVAWIAAGAVGVSVGGPLLKDAFRGGAPAELTDRARRLVDVVGAAVTARENGQ